MTTKQRVYPTSLFQEIFWWGEKFTPTSSLMPWSVRLAGPLSTTRLMRALADVMQRHPTLRATYELTSDGSLVHRVHDQMPAPLTVIDVQNVPPDELSAVLAAQLYENLHRPIDLATAPPFEMTVQRRSDDEFFVSLVMSHIGFDGTAIPTFLAEVAEAYNARGAGRPRVLPDLLTSGPDIAAKEDQLLRSDAASAHLAYWTQFFAGVPVVLRSPLFPGRDGASPRKHRASVISRELLSTQQLRDFAVARRSTPFQVTLACFQLLLHRYSGSPRIAIGSMFDARDDPQHVHVVASLARDMWMGSVLSEDDTFSTFLARSRLQFFEWLAHRELPAQELGLAPYASLAGLKSYARWAFQGLPADLAERRLRLDEMAELEPLPDQRLVNTWHDERPPPDDPRVYPDTHADVRVFFEHQSVRLQLSARGAPGGAETVAADFHRLLLRCLAEPESSLAELLADIQPVPAPEGTVDLLGTPIPTQQIVQHLRELDGVLDAAVVVSRSEPFEWLDAYLLVSDAPPDLITVHRHLAAALPSFPIPRRVFTTGALPADGRPPGVCEDACAVPLGFDPTPSSPELSILTSVWAQTVGWAVRYPSEPVAQLAHRDLLYCVLFARRLRDAGLIVTVDDLLGQPHLAAVAQRIAARGGG